MKTSEKIKDGLQCCFGNERLRRCYRCPYIKKKECMDTLGNDVRIYVTKLEARLSKAGLALKGE